MFRSSVSPHVILFALAALPGLALAFAGGSGSQVDPYQIATAQHLDQVRNDLTAYYVLINDIDLDTAPFNSGAGWEPIGDGITPFTGQLDGAGFEIRNLFINRPAENNVGLFGNTETGGAVPGATILDLVLSSVDVTGRGNVGALAGNASDGLRADGVSVNGSVVAEDSRAGCLSGRLRSDSIAENIHVSCALTSNDTSTNVRIGGVAGELEDDAMLINVHSEATVISVNNGGYVGGLIGEVENNAQILRSHFSGTVSGGRRVGGLAGQLQGSILIAESWSSGSVTGEQEVGGLVGDLSSTSSIVASFSTGALTATGECVGGLVGLARGDSTVTDAYAWGPVSGGQLAGGLVGCAEGNSSVTTSYATGTVSGVDTGGLVASVDGFATFTNSYWDRIATGQTSSAGLPQAWGLTTSEMQGAAAASNMAGFDFADIWATVSGGYPVLQWQPPAGTPPSPPDPTPIPIVSHWMVLVLTLTILLLAAPALTRARRPARR